MSRLLGIRVCLAIVIVGLVISGVTAFPLEAETRAGAQLMHSTGIASALPDVASWVDRVADALRDTGTRYPFLAYGTDWLAFAHLVIALAMVGPWRDPERNRFVVTWATVACAGVVPLALIAGQVRGIPWGWRLLDCSFGLIAVIPLLIANRLIARMVADAGVAAAERAATV